MADINWNTTFPNLVDWESRFFKASAANPASFRLHEDTDNGSHYVGVAAPAALGANRSWVFPDTDGTFMSSVGGTATRVPFYNASGVIASDAGFVYDPTVGSTGALTAGGLSTYNGVVIAQVSGSQIIWQHGEGGMQFLGPSGAHVGLMIASQFSSIGHQFRGTHTSHVGLSVKLIASAAADAFEIRNSSNTLLMAIDTTGAIEPASLADGSAPNNSIYYSTTASKLVYKDSGGTVNNLY